MAVGAAQGLEGIEQLRQGNYWTGAGDIGFGAMGFVPHPTVKPLEPHMVVKPNEVAALQQKGYKLVAQHDDGTVSMALGERSNQPFKPPSFEPPKPTTIPERGKIPIWNPSESEGIQFARSEQGGIKIGVNVNEQQVK